VDFLEQNDASGRVEVVKEIRQQNNVVRPAVLTLEGAAGITS